MAVKVLAPSATMTGEIKDMTTGEEAQGGEAQQMIQQLQQRQYQ